MRRAVASIFGASISPPCKLIFPERAQRPSYLANDPCIYSHRSTEPGGGAFLRMANAILHILPMSTVV
jgi:hypothetical protein